MGNIAFRQYRSTLERIDQLLRSSGNKTLSISLRIMTMLQVAAANL